MGIGFSFFFCHKSWVNSWRKKTLPQKNTIPRSIAFFLKLSIDANSSETTSVIYRISFQWTKRVWIHTQREELGGKKGAELYLSDNSPRWFFPYQFFVFHLQSQKLPLFAMSFTRISSLQRSREIKSFNKWRFTWRYAQRKHGCLATKCVFFTVWDLGPWEFFSAWWLQHSHKPPHPQNCKSSTKTQPTKKVSGDTHPTRHSENPSL